MSVLLKTFVYIDFLDFSRKVGMLIGMVFLYGSVFTIGMEAVRGDTFVLSSPAFDHGGEIPEKYTCDGQDIAPPLEWTGIPENTRSLVLIIEDPDAPDPQAPKLTWVHWMLYNIPPEITSLPEGMTDKNLPPGVLEGLNDWKVADYGGPCPPIGKHRYFHRLYALDTVLSDLDNPTRADLGDAMEGHILSQIELMGTYERSR